MMAHTVIPTTQEAKIKMITVQDWNSTSKLDIVAYNCNPSYMGSTGLSQAKTHTLYEK
jgi:hypothetical protein